MPKLKVQFRKIKGDYNSVTYLSRAKLIGNYSNGSFFYRESKIGHVHAIRSYGKWSTSTHPLPQTQFHFSKLFSSILQSVSLGKKTCILNGIVAKVLTPPPPPLSMLFYVYIHLFTG